MAKNAATGSGTGNQVIGKVFIIYGTVKAVAPDGTVRILAPNSPVFADEKIITESDGSVSIMLDGPPPTQLDLGRMSEMILDQDVYAGATPEAVTEATAEAQQIQEALLQGDQPIELEATAAGGDAGAGGGHPIVIFGLTGSEVTPGSGAETTGITTTTSDTTGGVLGAIPQPTGLSGVVTLTATESISEHVGTITYTATLSSPPEGPVTVTLSNGATITVADGATSGSVTVAAPGDDVYVDAGFVNVTITSATSDNFENLAFEPLALTKTIITDTSDTTTVTLNDVTVTEGAGTATISASVSNLVTGSELLITLSNGATITIPVGASTGTSTPFAVQGDDPYVDGESYTVSISGAMGGNFEALNTADTAKVTVNDDIDTTTAVLSVVEGPELGENGYSITYQVELQDAQGNPVVLQAGQEVTVSVNITDPNNEAADPLTFTITGGNSSDTEIYSHADVDPYIETESISAAIDAKSVSVNEGNLENLAANTEAVSVGLTDVPDTTTVTLTGTPSVEEGGIITYTAELDSPVRAGDAPVIVTLSNSQTITITSGATGSVTATAPSGGTEPSVIVDISSVRKHRQARKGRSKILHGRVL